MVRSTTFAGRRVITSTRLDLAALFCLLIVSPALGAVAPADTLVLVNGDPITAGDLDKMVMEAHASFKAGDRDLGSVDRLLDKRVNDYLLLQDAMAVGYDQEEDFVAMMDENRRRYAIGVYVRDNVMLPDSAPADSVRAFFDRYYWRIEMRRISVRTREEAEALRAEVAGGADMDSLAREFSLDSKKLQGGLYNLLYWADVENSLRDLVRGLKAGDLSAISPYNDAFTFVRVERILPVHDEAFASFEREITTIVHGELRQRAWDRFVRTQVEAVDLQEEIGGLMAIAADSAQVLTAEFLREQPDAVIGIANGPGISGTQLRRAIGHEAMQNALLPFARHMAVARRDQTNDLVLGELAAAAGYLENPEVLDLLEKDWERELIERYLDDHVAAKIVFKRDEFETFYKENQERFRGPDEVRLDVMILKTPEDAAEASRRLGEGADFGYVFKQYNPGQEIALGQSRFIKITELSKPFRDALADLSPGQSSPAVEMPMGWMVFKLDARRRGELPPLESVEMEIRRVMYKIKFDEILAAQLALLRDKAEIKRWPDRVDAYLRPAGEG